MAAFRQGLKETGFVEGQNVAIEYPLGGQINADRLPALVAELIRRPVAVIVGDNNSAFAAKAATTTVPIVFASGGDPVRQGLVASLNRPGGNVTGVNFFWRRVGGQAAGAVAPARAQGDNNWRAREPEHSRRPRRSEMTCRPRRKAIG